MSTRSVNNIIVPEMANEFDFIVVGGGTAGNVVAGRLAEKSEVSVLVIEAGRGDPEEIEEVMTPDRAFECCNGPNDWKYKSTFSDRPDYIRVEKPNTRGKVLGGSSGNYFTWLRGSKGTFDDWEAFESPDWSWEGTKEYFDEPANYHDDDNFYPRNLGTSGPLQITHAELALELCPFSDMLVQAWESDGLEVKDDIYSGRVSGLTHCANTTYKGLRSSSWSYLLGKSNVHFLSSSHGTRLVIEGDRATGVEVRGPYGEDVTVKARKEVIVAGGFYESPKLLMLSGIGPAAELAKWGIGSIFDSPHVGQNLPLGGKDPFGPAGQPHFEVDFVPMFADAFQWHFPIPNEGNWLTVIDDLMRPISELGFVKLQSADPLVDPYININFLEDDLDVIAFRERVGFVDDILMTDDRFEDIIGEGYPWSMPRNLDEAMDKLILELSQTGFHPCGTCRLSNNIEEGVVDGQLKVHGFKNLRVIDASVFPVIPDCRIQDAVYMVGEKGADIIKAAHTELY